MLVVSKCKGYIQQTMSEVMIQKRRNEMPAVDNKHTNSNITQHAKRKKKGGEKASRDAR